MPDVKGRIHSVETCGTVDGPGIRYILFVQGCALRCVYCHNPDTWNCGQGREVGSREILAEISKYESYMKFSAGGVTISGGEPLLQPEFVCAVLDGCRQMGIHTAVDTAGCVKLDSALAVLEKTDLVLLDLKTTDPALHRQITGAGVEQPRALARELDRISKPVWIRHVLVSGLTDRDDLLHALGEFACGLKNVERIDVLPYHAMGHYKWEELGVEYTLGGVQAPSAQRVENAKRILAGYGLDVF